MNTAFVNLGSGLIAGFAAAIISQPADTMLSKINKTKGLPGQSTTSRLVQIAKELGLRGSFGGIGARLFMVGTLTAGQFAIYGDSKSSQSVYRAALADPACSQEGPRRRRRCRHCRLSAFREVCNSSERKGWTSAATLVFMHMYKSGHSTHKTRLPGREAWRAQNERYRFPVTLVICFLVSRYKRKTIGSGISEHWESSSVIYSFTPLDPVASAGITRAMLCTAF